MLILNTVFVDFTQRLFFTPKFSVVDDQLAFLTLVVKVMVNPSGFIAPETDAASIRTSHRWFLNYSGLLIFKQ